MFNIFSNDQSLENYSGHNHQHKSNCTYCQYPRKKIIFFGRKMIVIVWKEFRDVRGHGEVRKCHHRGSDCDERIIQPELLIRKNSMLCKKVNVQEADGKANID